MWALDHRIKSAPGIALYVRALTDREDASTWFDQWDEPEELRRGLAMRAMVAMTLCDEHGVRSLTYEHTGMLDPLELATLAIYVTVALNIISPVMWRCDLTAWRDYLKKGAAHHSNVATMVTLAECGDIDGFIGHRQWSPDRYYGKPVCELTGGQLLAYDAALLAYRDNLQATTKEKKWPIQKSPANPR